MTDFTREDLDALQQKARPKGVLPWLPRERDPETLRVWITHALHCPPGWVIRAFERAGRDKTDPCSITLHNGRDGRVIRVPQQRDLEAKPRSTLLGLCDGWLAIPHLTNGEAEDLWAALITFGNVLTEHDDMQETREWVEQMLPVTLPLTGFSLTPDGRHDALMAIKHVGEFTKPDALSLVRPGDVEQTRYQQRPCRFIDKTTGEQWLRTGETAAFIRWVVGVEPLSHATLRARLHEIGVDGKLFEAWQPPHPKLQLYSLPDELTEGLR
jgi:hypothetical protein